MAGFKLHSMLVDSSFVLAELPLSTLLLSNDKQYPWFILVPRVVDIKDIHELEWEDQLQFLNESSMLSELLMELYQGEKMNVAALGNICPQLHVHHIVRFKNDIAWPGPVWGAYPAIAYLDDELEALKSKLMPALGKIVAQAS